MGRRRARDRAMATAPRSTARATSPGPSFSSATKTAPRSALAGGIRSTTSPSSFRTAAPASRTSAARAATSSSGLAASCSARVVTACRRRARRQAAGQAALGRRPQLRVGHEHGVRSAHRVAGGQSPGRRLQRSVQAGALAGPAPEPGRSGMSGQGHGAARGPIARPGAPRAGLVPLARSLAGPALAWPRGEGAPTARNRQGWVLPGPERSLPPRRIRSRSAPQRGPARCSRPARTPRAARRFHRRGAPG